MIKLVLILAVFCFTGCKESPKPLVFAPNPPEIGRYQLISANYIRLAKTSERHEQGLFKIDTVTGKVWQYWPSILGKKDDKDFWSPVGD